MRTVYQTQLPKGREIGRVTVGTDILFMKANAHTCVVEILT
jgi:hypothetical protein